MVKISNVGQLKEIISKKMANDVSSIFKSVEASLFRMLNDVIDDRVYNAYDPLYYRRTYTLKNSIESESGFASYGKSSSIIAARVYINKEKIVYSNGKTDIPQRVNENRVKRREDRWRTTLKSSHFSTFAEKGLEDTRDLIESKLIQKGYIKK